MAAFRPPLEALKDSCWTEHWESLSTVGVREPTAAFSSVLPPPRLLAAARTLVRLSQRQLAAEAGIDRSLICRYEAGTSKLRSDSFGAILTVLRKYGIRFIGESDEVAMGVLLIKKQVSKRGSSPESEIHPEGR